MAQVPRTLDSVVVYLKNHPVRDTSYVLALNAYSWQLLQRSDFGRADSVLRRAAQLATRLHYDYGLQQTYYNLGLSYYYQDKSKLALPYTRKAQQLITRRHFPAKDEQMVLSLLGVIYFTLHDYDQSLRLYLGAIRLTETHRLTYRVTPAYLGVGNVLRVMHKKEEALVYYRKALLAAEQEPEKRMMVLAKNHMGDALSSLDKPRYAEALTYYQQALPIAETCGARGPLSDVLTNIGQMHLDLGHHAKAVAYLRRSEKICTEDSLTDQLGAVCWIMGRTYEVTRQYALAEQYLSKALQLARQIGDVDETRTRTQTLANFYAKTAQYQRAYQYQQQTTQLNDSLFNVQSARHAQELATQYETEKKEQQLKLLNEKSQRASVERNALLLVGTLLLLLGVAVSAWLLNRARLRRLQEAQTLRQQIAHDLHDEVGSTLSSISLLSGMVNGLIAQNRPESVERAIQKINTDARQILEAVDEIIWTINPGNDSLYRIALRLQEYAQPLMESKNIRFTFETDAALADLPVSMDVRRNLYLIGKEAINNLVKYSEATQATVRFEHRKDQLSVLIEDNGRGFDPARPNLRTGQTSMQQRAKAMGGTLTVRSAPGQGTTLELTAASL
ncbi:MAG: tetratricopeptide repeat protein [Bacteroidetes bacterium]|nr:tetratricopeptide repeat protein [Fibrella sp.]